LDFKIKITADELAVIFLGLNPESALGKKCKFNSLILNDLSRIFSNA